MDALHLRMLTDDLRDLSDRLCLLANAIDDGGPDLSKSEKLVRLGGQIAEACNSGSDLLHRLAESAE